MNYAPKDEDFKSDISSSECHFSSNSRANIQLIELAWTAGFVDGEGCIHISKTHLPGRKNPTYRLILNITQNHRASLERVAAALGVEARLHRLKRTVKMNRDVDAFNICDQHAHRCLKVLLPYLGRKRPEALVAIEAYENCSFNVHPGPKGHPPSVWVERERAYKKLRNMK